jgi:hypothetical protein
MEDIAYIVCNLPNLFVDAPTNARIEEVRLPGVNVSGFKSYR